MYEPNQPVSFVSFIAGKLRETSEASQEKEEFSYKVWNEQISK